MPTPTVETGHPSVTSSSLHDLEAMALTTVRTIENFLPEIRMVAGYTPYGGALIQGVTMMTPMIERILIFAMAETGKPFLEVAKDFLQHVTPGQADQKVFGPYQGYGPRNTPADLPIP